MEQSLVTIHDITNENLGSLCVTKAFRPLTIALNTARYEGARQKVDLAAAVLAEVGVNRHGGKETTQFAGYTPKQGVPEVDIIF